MILPDVNILVHAVNADSPRNTVIRTWWDHVLSGRTPVYLPWIVILGFLRITTNPRVFSDPLPIGIAERYVDEWLSLSPVRTINPGEGHWHLVKQVLSQAGTSGNLTTDAHIAALSIQWDCTVYSTDTDFARFPGIKWKQL